MRNAISQMISRHEGLRLDLYKCPADKWTIGYGRNLEDNGIREDEALLMLNNDIDQVLHECRRAFSWFDRLDNTRQDVVLDMVFNLGVTRFLGFKKMISALSEGDYITASEEMMDSRWAKQVKSRAETLRQMMVTGDYPHWIYNNSD